jgi:hypothetical protein
MAKHVFSTLSADTRYAQWVNQEGVNTVLRSVLVRGGAGVALRGAGQQVATPFSLRTEVSDSDADFLANHKMFKQHQDRGHVRIESIARDPEKVAQKMDKDGGSAPKTPEDVKKDAEEAAKKSGLKPEETLQAVANKGK